MTFGLPSCRRIDFAVLAMGVFGFAEILRNLENTEEARRGQRRSAAFAVEEFRQAPHRSPAAR